MTGQTGWEDILDPGETVLWQGRPDTKVVIRLQNMGGFLLGLFFAGFALFWMFGAAQAGGFVWMFGLIHFAVGLGMAFGAFFWSAIRRRYSWYTLTDRRAFIASHLPLLGRKLKSYPIRAGTVLEFDGGMPATIIFAEETRRTKRGSRQVPIGFERIAEGPKVYRLMRDIQERKAS